MLDLLVDCEKMQAALERVRRTTRAKIQQQAFAKAGKCIICLPLSMRRAGLLVALSVSLPVLLAQVIHALLH